MQMGKGEIKLPTNVFVRLDFDPCDCRIEIILELLFLLNALALFVEEHLESFEQGHVAVGQLADVVGQELEFFLRDVGFDDGDLVEQRVDRQLSVNNQ